MGRTWNNIYRRPTLPSWFVSNKVNEHSFPHHYQRPSSSSSSKRWQTRHGNDHLAIQAKVQGLKSRAAFKLLESKINDKYRLFKRGQTVVDLGYAPGSWSQVALDRTHPTGRVVGIDIIPAQPPKGVSTIQGNFLSQGVQNELKRFLCGSDRGRMKPETLLSAQQDEQHMTEDDFRDHSMSYLEAEKRAGSAQVTLAKGPIADSKFIGENSTGREQRVVDIILSDMSAPWAQTDGFWKKSLSDPYRMMNTSGMSFRDHAGSMDLCHAALRFAFDALHTGGHFVCKFYQGSEDKALELRLKALFAKVHREKPESSRSESKEAYFVALKRRGNVKPEDVFEDR